MSSASATSSASSPIPTWRPRSAGWGASRPRSRSCRSRRRVDRTTTSRFSEGLTEELIHRLSGIPDLRVISRTSAMAYAGTEKTLPEIADELGVDAVVEGTARRADGRVQVIANLVDARNDRTLWSGQYGCEAGALFDVQADLALRVARALEATLTDEQRERIETRPTSSLEAYNLWLLGRYHQVRWTPENSGRAIECYEEALDADPEFADGYVGLANTELMLGMLVESVPSGEVFPRAPLRSPSRKASAPRRGTRGPESGSSPANQLRWILGAGYIT